MSGGHLHPAPHRDRLSPLKASFLLYTGPLAWLTQLAIGFGLTSWPCFPAMDHLEAPLAGYQATHTLAILILLGCAAIAWIAGIASWRTFLSVRGEREGDHDDLVEIGHGRTRFIALWGVYLGLGFGCVTLLTLVAFALVPRCLG